MDGASLVRAGAVALSDWKNANPEAPIVASAATFENLILSGSDFTRASFRNCLFIDCNFRQSSFFSANLEGSRFIRCDLSGCNFSEALLKNVSLDTVDLAKANFTGAYYLGRMKRLVMRPSAETAPIYSATNSHWIDRWVGWDRLRFLSTIRIFVPAYLSLALSVVALSAIAWFNGAVDGLNAAFSNAAGFNMSVIPRIEASWTHTAVVVNFLLLAFAATAFLGCPARITEFTRERWTFELGKSELLYDHAAWQRPVLRGFCAASLALGGALSSFLLARGIATHIAFVLPHLN